MKTNRFQAVNVSADRVVGALQTEQHVRPHESPRAALMNVAEATGISAEIVVEVMRTLKLDGHRSVGRLRSSELMQAARAMQRLNASAAIGAR